MCKKFKFLLNPKIIIKIICLIFCFIQIKNISYLYFKYETTTEVKYENGLYFSLPSITLCFSKDFLLRDGFREKHSKKLSNKLFFQEINENLTISEQMEVIQSPEAVLRDNCFVYRPIVFDGNESTDDPYIPCHRISGYRMSLSRKFLCFTLFQQMSNQSEDRYLIDYDRNTRNDRTALMKLSRTPSDNYVILHAHSRSVKVQTLFDLDYGIADIMCERIYFSFRKSVIQLLPKPYETECVDHKQWSFDSRYDCLMRCKVRRYLETTGKFPFNFLSYELNSSFKFDNEFSAQNDLRFGDECRKSIECDPRPDCYREYYKITDFDRIKPWKSEQVMNNSLLINFPTRPATVTIHKPKIYLEEFLCYIASIFSLWFGVSIVFLSNHCLKLIKKTMSKVNNKIYPVKLF